MSNEWMKRKSAVLLAAALSIFAGSSITETRNKTAAAPNDLLDGKMIALLQSEDQTANKVRGNTQAADQSKPLFQVIIKPAGANLILDLDPQSGRMTAEAGLMSLISWAYDVPKYRVFNRLPESTQGYQMSVVTPPGREDLLHPLAQQALETTFGFKTRREMREFDVLALSAPEAKAANLRPSEAETESVDVSRSRLKGQRQPLKKLTEFLTFIMNRPVVEETGLKEKYDWDLPYNQTNDEVIITAVREQLGLEMTKAKRSLETLIVEKAEPPKRKQ